MNKPLSLIPDVQSSIDTRRLTINKVGIKALKHPLQVLNREGKAQSTVAICNMSVELAHHQKGTHMSRFIELLNADEQMLSMEAFKQLLSAMVQRLEAQRGYIEFTFPYFIRKQAPVSGVASYLDYEITLLGEINEGIPAVVLKTVIPVTSLCPCSKKISAYGAHNQRSHVTVSVRPSGPIWIEDLIELVEQQASSELFGLLKRSDEKLVTERAYENPKFVEDMVRDVAAQLNHHPHIAAYCVEAENFESIHNHSAYAIIEKDKLSPCGSVISS
ncbi:GTP cyclohydrolase FolE2 [Thioflexithrix psekupsensis]|uniref:GTP cyclohydrolase FolE2 n=1 Tax=Thioflexithrix psekupsensis TaxID=1570016 RepID=A0A251XBJ5_9GAMM|nr:GTP cyclohydrolase FolE2 [Thioflexithrix psekupsensis]OUD15678.1 GTP cyclohydrolase [Thioflexithrix psekupsensis]